MYSAIDIANYADQYRWVSLIIAVIAIVANYMMFEKAGEKGWKAIIPIYNTYIKAKIGANGGFVPLLIGSILLIIGYFALIIGVVGVSLTVNTNYGTAIWAGLGLVLVGAILAIIGNCKMAKGISTVFGQETGFAVGLFFLPTIFTCIIAFDKKYEYVGPYGAVQDI